MKKKIFIATLVLVTVITFTACNNASKETDKEKMQPDPTHKKDADTLGMKMGGNELDSKKK